jgi:hypothetical protein
MSIIPETIQNFLPLKRKKTPSGWWVFNAVCCPHTGHTPDTRQRGGFIINSGDVVTYHCFNCQFKASWQPGRQLSPKMKSLMRWLGISDDTINKLSIDALRLLNEQSNTTVSTIIPTFNIMALPPDTKPIIDYLDNPPEKLMPILKYMTERNLYLEDYDFHWTPKPGYSNRLIMPFYYNNQIVGHTARAINDAKPKYLSDQQPGYVFNLDKQHNTRNSVIVLEGPIDAISIEGCAILGAHIKDSQDWLLRQLGKEIILVPDRDHEGPTTVKQAIEYGWSVSLPEWPYDPSWDHPIKDVNDAVNKIGRLATIWLIMKYKQSNALKIQLRAKKWF